jgi:hypothetical protein
VKLLSWWGACEALSALAALALATLLAVYVRNHRRAPSRFSMGLVVFAGAFLIEALGSMLVWLRLSAEYDGDIAVPMMALRLAEVAGVGVLTWVSLE